MATSLAERRPFAVATRALARLNAAIDERISVRALVPLRVALGPLVIFHLRPFLTLAADGSTYRDQFHVPFAAWYPVLPDPLYLAALWLAIPAAVALSIGLFTRATSGYLALFIGYNLFVSRTHFHHNRAFLLVLLIAAALLPLGGNWSIDALRQRTGDRTRTGLRWPLMLLRYQVATVYVSSGFSKLIDADWWGGTVLRLRVERYGSDAVAAGVPEWIVDGVGSAGFSTWFAKVVVLTELFIGIGLLVRRTRLGAVWVAIPFHVAIQFSASVQIFTFAALAALVIWVTPTVRDRVVRGASPRHARAIQILDWTGRFRIEPASDHGDGIVVVDRDGTEHRGRAAWRLVFSRLPLTFWIAAPLRLAADRR